VALKGNLLYNGDFETGTAEGWITGPFGKPFPFNFSVSSEAKHTGNYGGLLYAPDAYLDGYLAYNRTCSFEEYEAYLFIMSANMVAGLYNAPILWGLDDKGNLIEEYAVAYNDETGLWRRYITLLRGFRGITHFQVGLWYFNWQEGDKLYFDEVKLIPLRSIKGHEISEYRHFTNITTNWDWYSSIACVGKCKLRSIVRTENVSGTSPTLDIIIEIFLMEKANTYYTLTHSQFTGEDFEEVNIDLPEASVIRVFYTVGGSSPSFDIYHFLRLEPY